MKISICKGTTFHIRNKNISYAAQSDIYGTDGVGGVIAL